MNTLTRADLLAGVTTLFDPFSLAEFEAARFIRRVTAPPIAAIPANKIEGHWREELHETDRQLITAAILCCSWSEETHAAMRAALMPLVEVWLREANLYRDC